MPNITNTLVHQIYYPDTNQISQASQANQLDQFCNGRIDGITSEILDTLVNAAAAGDLDSIEFLYNIALQEGKLGKAAEDALFDVFSLKIPGKIGVDKQIQQMGLQLYQIFANDRDNYNSINMLHKLSTQSKLAYIVGSAITNTTDRLNLSKFVFNEPDIWGSNRMINSDELGSGMQAVLKDSKKSKNFSLNYPMELALLDSQISQKEALWNKTECFAVNTGEHWIFFALYKQNNEKKALVFNSWHSLDKGIRKKLANVATHAGAKSLTYIEKDLQQSVPNGCALFVIKAIEKIAESPDEDPVKVLKDVRDVFLTHSIEEQEKFNFIARRQLYAMHMEKESTNESHS